MTDKVLILDYGSQYTQLITRRIREIGVYSEIHPWDWSQSDIEGFAASAVILSGGPGSASGQQPQVAECLLRRGAPPLLAICYGMQQLARQLGARVEASSSREFGPATVRARGHSELLRDIQNRCNDQGHGLLDVWMSHGDQVMELPPGYKCIASTGAAAIAGMADEENKRYCLQFHPEVTHTTKGMDILQRFVKDIASCEASWNPGYIEDNLIQQIQQQSRQGKVLLALSGGLDSGVCAALLQRAISDRLVCIFVDNGLLRQDEAKQVMQVYHEGCGIDVRLVRAEQDFMQALEGVNDPEQKRHVIGHKFIEIFSREADKIGGIEHLAQGTIYPDVVESAGTSANKGANIKSHHNVGGLPENLPFKLLEPLRSLFKDEVRQLGARLGIPDSTLHRHPFPGPGLAVRMPGAIDTDQLNILRQADAIFTEELHSAGWYHKLSQAFAVFLPVKTVGVQGDNRRYEYVIALRAVQTTDFMTARWAHLPYSLLDKSASRIVNEVAGITRVVYDISNKPPATIEWE
ncbi:MAG: glutamine-hydrolyzing GMP synthase [Candidatus Porifericomitaceae bacterium WSBS_2022_MAG_OTU9]